MFKSVLIVSVIDNDDIFVGYCICRDKLTLDEYDILTDKYGDVGVQCYIIGKAIKGLQVFGYEYVNMSLNKLDFSKVKVLFEVTYL